MEWDKVVAWIVFAFMAIGGIYSFCTMLTEHFSAEPVVAKDSHLLCTSCGKYKEYDQVHERLCLGCVERAERDKEIVPIRVALPVPSPRFVTATHSHAAGE